MIEIDLYITDLDGTLLNSEKKISKNTALTINKLIEEGMNFTIATARPPECIKELVSPLNLRLPAIFHNGVFVYDFINQEYLTSNFLKPQVVKDIMRIIELENLSPLVYTLEDNGSSSVYYKGIYNYGGECYIKGKLANGDRRFKLINNFDEYFLEGVFSLVVIAEDEKLDSLYKLLNKKYEANYNYVQDIYSKFYWLEITNKESNKKSGVTYLKNYLKADRLICFGDNLNDLPMFEVCDYCFAVSNANSTVKDIATKVIGSNDEDGVAMFLKSVFTSKNADAV
jgi:5-amino-6-(5-phospho-D-ribitylamino)uracil phosphatase